MSNPFQRMILAGGALAVAASTLLAQETARKAEPPMAKKNSKVVTLHGDTLRDDYHWLRDKEDPEVKAYLDSENAYTDAVMKETEALQKKLYDEMLARIKETDLSVPYRKGNYFYYYRTEKGKQYRIYCRKKGSLEAPEEVTLDLNEIGKTERFVGLGEYEVSDDGNLLAYSIDPTGFRVYTLFVKDLRTGKVLPEKMLDVASSAWASDNKTLFYTTKDAAKRSYRLWRHVLGEDAGKDVLLHDEKDEMFSVYVWRTRSRSHLLFGSESLTTSEYRFLPADQPQGTWRMIAPRQKDREYAVEHRGDFFYIRVNDRGRNFRVVTAPVSDPSVDNWKEVVPHREDVMITGIDAFAEHLAISEREDGLPRIRVTDFAFARGHRVEFPDPVYDVSATGNMEFDTKTLRYAYQSFIIPESIYDYDMATRKAVLRKRTEVLGGYDPARYESERVYATAADGTKIPISLLYLKGTRRDGKNPMLLKGYGSYGSSYDVDFASNRFSLVDRGVIFGYAHIRGGGELGKKWHDAGRMLSKKNTFTDFIAAAEHLIAQKYTGKDRLAIEGGSAGGLLMGAVTNLRPDLFHVVVSHVPFVDVINTMLDESIPLTVGEFEEWGNPKIPEQYAYMKSYSPYDNLAAKDYPAMLVKTSFDDSQVMYWEPAKYVARLRTMKTDKNPLIFKINMAGGHGGSSGRYDRLKEIAFDYAFILRELGVQEPKRAS